jgi:hypothetical protein
MILAVIFVVADDRASAADSNAERATPSHHAPGKSLRQIGLIFPL